MYADSGLMPRYMQTCSPDIHQFEDLFKSYKLSDEEMRNGFAERSNLPEYDIGEEGDLFNAPDSILEEPILTVDPLSAALTMISCGEDSSQGLCDLPDLDLGSFQSDQQLLDNAFYECEQDLMMKSATMESPLSEVLDVKNISVVTTGINESQDMQKSVSSGKLRSMDWSHAQQEAVVVQNFPGFAQLDFGSDYRMRRAFSEGDIQKLGTGHFQSPLDMIIVSCTSEDRREKLSRYRNKKSRRNFGRKIKYACRKALADNQPRIRGRFAKTEERK
ncbi:CCT motif family protein [Raphanus sativus]|nr:CCT motif family protein [Raphanus sativus]